MENYRNYSFAGGMVALFAYAVFYILLGFYLDQVIPSGFGVPKKWYFPCVCCCNKKSERVLDEERIPLNQAEEIKSGTALTRARASIIDYKYL